jgi:hypothetical protein
MLRANLTLSDPILEIEGDVECLPLCVSMYHNSVVGFERKLIYVLSMGG